MTAASNTSAPHKENANFMQLTSLFLNNTKTLLMLLGLSSLLWVATTQSAFAQPDVAINDSSAELPKDENTFTMNMREADIRAFIQWIADRTGKNVIVHRSVQGTVTVISSKAVNREEAYELFLTVLNMNGFAAVETDGGVQIIPNAEAKTSDIPFKGNEQNRGDIVTAIIELQYVDAAEFIQTLRPLAPATAHMAPYTPTNSIIVADSARSIARTQKIIDLLDQEEGEFDYEIVPIVHASAEDIEKILSAILKSSSAGGDKNQPQSQSLEIAVDKRSNSILLTGNVKRRLQIRRLISKLDTPLDGDGNTSVVYLNYIEAAEIAPILEGVGDSLLKETKTEGLKEFSIQASETNNALVISAPPAVMNSIKSVIKQLDIQRAQVMVEAVVVRLTDTLGDDFGLAAVGSDIYDGDPDGSIGGVNLSGNTGAAGLFSTVIAADAETSTGEALAGALGGASGLTYGYLEDGNLIAALRAISSRSASNIMSTPTVVALDNQEAKLLVGQNVPFITGSATSGGANVTNPFTTVERQDIGVTLDIKPRINQGDAITLEITQTTENVASVLEEGIITDKTEIQTSALIKDGQVLVIGGLMSETDTETRSQVPILGDIPGLGKLFRSTSKSRIKSNLLVFIKPTILKDQLQIAGITADRYAFVREQQMLKAMQTFLDYREPVSLEEFEVYSPESVDMLKQSDTENEIVTGDS